MHNSSLSVIVHAVPVLAWNLHTQGYPCLERFGTWSVLRPIACWFCPCLTLHASGVKEA